VLHSNTKAPARIIAETLFESRTVLLFGEITTELAERVTAELVALSTLGPAPIRLVIHSPGGHVESGDTIHDAIRCIRAPVYALGTGWVASAGALIYVAVPRERRYALPNTRFLLHQPSGGVGGPASDVEIEAQQVLSMRERLNRLFAEATGQSLAKVAKDTDRNHWMTAEAAREYGLVHRIVERLEDVPPSDSR
jgi:ATP-dependent Clp protease protease subunit